MVFKSQEGFGQSSLNASRPWVKRGVSIGKEMLSFSGPIHFSLLLHPDLDGLMNSGWAWTKETSTAMLHTLQICSDVSREQEIGTGDLKRPDFTALSDKDT